MEYVEYLRVRKAFFVFAVIVAAVTVLIVVSVFAATHGALGGHVVVNGRHVGASEMQSPPIPLGVLLGIAGYAAVVFATICASSLNKEHDGLNFVFVKPVPRSVLALRYVAVDAAGILAAFAYALLVIEVFPLASFGLLRDVYVDGRAWWVGGLGLGVAFMWYGLLQAITVQYRGKGGTIVGFSWAFFAIMVTVPALTFLGPIVGKLVFVIELFNPLAYFTAIADHPSGYLVSSILGFALETRVALVWAIAGLSIAYAVTA